MRRTQAENPGGEPRRRTQAENPGGDPDDESEPEGEPEGEILARSDQTAERQIDGDAEEAEAA
jgi:hypothetical protein